MASKIASSQVGLLILSAVAIQSIALDGSRVLKKKQSLTYETARNAVIDVEDLLSLGGRVVLSEKEELANSIFMKYKLEELSDGFVNPENYAPGMHFFRGKELVEHSKVFQLIKEMPKGALLHAHNNALVSSEWFIKNLTYMPGLMSCVNKKGVVMYSFRKSAAHDCDTPYVLVDEKRQMSWNKNAYDRQLERTINLYTPLPELEYPYINSVWTKFENMFGTVSDVTKYIPAFRAYHWRLLEELYEDGIMYVELRMEFKKLYDDNTEYEDDLAVTELMALVDRFRAENPDFLGVKVIYSTYRRVENAIVKQKLETFKRFHEAYPNFVIGFDLVGQEDLGYPLYDFVQELKNAIPPTAKYFFHAGETNWYGTSTDYNLLDAILLNTTRIGHGYALMKHPVLWNAVKKRGIAIEVSPISNQVLHLVWDLRNHPATFYFSENIPVVITCDDPGFWNSKALSYDFYYAIMSFAPNQAGLKTLKELVWNSIEHSILTDAERKEAFGILEMNWDQFLDFVIETDAEDLKTNKKP